MKKRLRVILKIIGFSLLGVILLAAGALVWVVVNPWPQTSGRLVVDGLLDTVTVERDRHGVPNIYAENDHDLFFAQGYVQAQDRLFQMEVHRRIGNGTLSELVGAPGLYVDKVSRIYGLRRIAEKSYGQLDGEMQAMLQAYSDGVNAYISTHRNKLPLEFTLLGAAPDAWTPMDTMSWSNMMALVNALNYGYELFRAQAEQKLGMEMTEDALPPYDPENPEIITKKLEQYSWGSYLKSIVKPGAVVSSAEQEAGASEISGLAWLRNPAIVGTLNLEDYVPGASQFGWASGTWAVSGQHTQSGKPILACDVHMGLNIPSLWYEVGLHNKRFEVSGFSLPGVPMVLLGHNRKIAWGFVNLNPDVTDLYREKLDKLENPTKYQYKDAWFDLERKQEVIKVKGAEPVVLDLLFTRHGPLVNDLLKITEGDLDDAKNHEKFAGQWPPLERERWEGTEPISLRWAVADGCLVVKSVYLLNQASNWDEFRHALSFWDSLGESFVYADTDGNIGYQAAAKVPVRGPKALGIRPVPGWLEDYEWKGFIPFDELPRLFNPPTGYVGTANNKVTTDDYPYLISYDWFHPGYRGRSLYAQLEKLIAEGRKLSVEDMRAVQADTYSYAADQLNKYLSSVKPNGELESQALAIALQWDGRFDFESVGASIYQTWYNYLDTNTFDDNLREKQVWGYGLPLKHIESLVNIMKTPDNPWFDNRASAERVETRDDIVALSFSQAVAHLAKNYGNDPAQWRFSRCQTVTLQHQVLNNVPYIGRFFNSQQTLPFAGSPTSVAFAFSYNTAPLTPNVTFAANQRHIVPLDELDNTLSVVSSGASGHIFHPNREDQMPLWANLQYHAMPFSAEAVKRNATATLVLETGR